MTNDPRVEAVANWWAEQTGDESVIEEYHKEFVEMLAAIDAAAWHPAGTPLPREGKILGVQRAPTSWHPIIVEVDCGRLAKVSERHFELNTRYIGEWMYCPKLPEEQK